MKIRAAKTDPNSHYKNVRHAFYIIVDSLTRGNFIKKLTGSTNARGYDSVPLSIQSHRTMDGEIRVLISYDATSRNSLNKQSKGSAKIAFTDKEGTSWFARDLREFRLRDFDLVWNDKVASFTIPSEYLIPKEKPTEAEVPTVTKTILDFVGESPDGSNIEFSLSFGQCLKLVKWLADEGVNVT